MCSLGRLACSSLRKALTAYLRGVWFAVASTSEVGFRVCCTCARGRPQAVTKPVVVPNLMPLPHRARLSSSLLWISPLGLGDLATSSPAWSHAVPSSSQALLLPDPVSLSAFWRTQLHPCFVLFLCFIYLHFYPWASHSCLKSVVIFFIFSFVTWSPFCHPAFPASYFGLQVPCAFILLWVCRGGSLCACLTIVYFIFVSDGGHFSAFSTPKTSYCLLWITWQTIGGFF